MTSKHTSLTSLGLTALGLTSLRLTTVGLSIIFPGGCSPGDQRGKSATPPIVHVVGAMRNVFWEGQISGAIDLDTIANKEHLYGLGPMEFLSGELLILDGISYKSTVAGDGTPVVDVTYRVKAPFFVYANVDTWREQILPDTVRTIEQLEPFLDNATKTTRRPFAFKLTGKVDSARFHIVNLPKGATVSSPTDAHRVEQSSLLTNRDCDILGFFSREHKGVFTHHDTFVHLHIITGDRTRMGHLDGVQLGKGTIKLSLPAESVR